MNANGSRAFVVGLTIFGPVVIGAILQSLLGSLNWISGRWVLFSGVILSLLLLGVSGAIVIAMGIRCVARKEWPVFSPIKYPFRPRSELRGHAAMLVGSLYALLGVLLGTSCVLLIASLIIYGNVS